MKLVDFIIIGAQKSATSAMAAQLAQHPDICFCAIKEPEYFSINKSWENKIGEYHKLYNPSSSQLCGEASTGYSMYPKYSHVAASLHAYNPGLRLIYVVRDPVARIVSHYMHQRLTDVTDVPIEEVVLRNPSYVNNSRYGVQVRQYLKHFPRANILIVTMEDYVGANEESFREIAGFLGLGRVDRVPELATKNVSLERREMKRFPGRSVVKRLINRLPKNVQGYVPGGMYCQLDKTPVLGDATKGALWELLRDDVEFIERLLGRRLGVLKNKYE